MGIYERDYMRDDYNPWDRRGKKPTKRPPWKIYVLIGAAVLGLGALLVAGYRSGESYGISSDLGPVYVVKAPYPIDLNTATLDELMSVPQIGPATAEQIIKRRPIEKLEDLLEIYGIGEAKLKVFSQYVKVDPPGLPTKEAATPETDNEQR